MPEILGEKLSPLYCTDLNQVIMAVGAHWLCYLAHGVKEDKGSNSLKIYIQANSLASQLRWKISFCSSSLFIEIINGKSSSAIILLSVNILNIQILRIIKINH